MKQWTKTAGMMAAVCLVLMADSPARGEPTAVEKATARALFDEGRRLVQLKNYAEACPKFEESQRLDPGVGTMFNLADCFESSGKTTSAWMLFLEVASKLRAEGQAEREQAARRRAAALEPRLSRISIVVAQAAQVNGLVIKRDGTEVTKPVWGQGIPVDLGMHTVEASAPGKKTWKQSVEVNKEAYTVTVNVPALEEGAGPVVTPPIASGSATPMASAVPTAQPTAQPTSVTPEQPPDGESGTGKGQRIAGLAVGGLGVVGLGVGIVLGLGAKSKYNDVGDNCVGSRCNQAGVDTRDDAVSAGNVATIISGIGLVAMAGGAVLYLTAPKGKKETTPTVGVGPGTVYVGGRW